MVATALTNPTTLGLPFACGTLDRLAAYLQEIKGIGMPRRRMDEILLAEEPLFGGNSILSWEP